MNDFKKIVLITLSTTLLSLLVTTNYAEEAAKSPWSGKAGLGFLSTDGNSETSSLNADFKLGHTIGRWTHGLKALAIQGATEGETTAERYFLGLKTDWAINNKSYVFGLIDAEKDRFSAYDLRTSETLGYGRKLINTNTRKWNVEIGAGVTQLNPIVGEDISDAILRLATDYHWAFSKTAAFDQTIGIESGETNTYIESVSSIKAKLFQDLGLRLAYSIKNNSDVPVGIEKTDTFTSISIEYSF